MTAAPRLPAFAVFAAMLAGAGLPLYLHAPKFYVEEYGVPLGALGTVLFLLRLIDVVQDPLLGRLAERAQAWRAMTVAIAVAAMAAGMIGLFAMPAPVHPLLWFAVMLSVVFSAFSYLTICFYAQGVASAVAMPGAGHLRLARWRETGALLGICAAAVAPVILGGHAGFALGFTLFALLALWAMRREWRAVTAPVGGLTAALRDPLARRLLLVALVNAAPVAVTSTLFLFFVEDRLDLGGWEGAYLVAFFLAAAIAAPVWGRLAERAGARRVLVAGMVLSILAFAFAATLGSGDAVAFALICIVSGAALGADMTLLPALFAARMADVSPSAAGGFGLWSFANKLALAVAAVVLLPLLEAGGYRPGQANDPGALWRLGLLYGAVPCALKLLAIALLATLPAATPAAGRTFQAKGSLGT